MYPSKKHLDTLVGTEIKYYASSASFVAPGVLRRTDRPDVYDVEVPGGNFLSFNRRDVEIDGNVITNVS